MEMFMFAFVKPGDLICILTLQNG
uniref:Uncharacterized protein n=1 Tax=Anguilla anguilla TaxID=7936 RepID=A0A0E9U3C0_ANGAN